MVVLRSTSLDQYLYAKNPLIPSSDIVNQRILQSDCTTGKPGHTQQKVVVSDATFLDDNLNARNLRYQLIPCRGIDV